MCHGLLVQLQRLLVKECHGCGSHHKAQPVPREECNMVQDAMSAVLEENKHDQTHTDTHTHTNKQKGGKGQADGIEVCVRQCEGV